MTEQTDLLQNLTKNLLPMEDWQDVLEPKLTNSALSIRISK